MSIITLEWESSSDGSDFDSDSNLIQRAVNMVQGDFAERTWQAFWKTTIEARAAVEVAGELGISLASV